MRGQLRSLITFLIFIILFSCNTEIRTNLPQPEKSESFEESKLNTSVKSSPTPSPTPIDTAMPQTELPIENPNLPLDTSEPEKPKTNKSPEPLPSNDFNNESYPLGGYVFDDLKQPLENVKISISTLRSHDIKFQSETFTDTKGKYFFSEVPFAYYEIKAEKEGYSPRRRVEFVRKHPSSPIGNVFDFGVGRSSTKSHSPLVSLALSDKPEIIDVNPRRNSKENAVDTSFKLVFSEPMDRQSVEDTFSVRVFISQKLTVDKRSLLLTFRGSENIFFPEGELIWDKNSFNIQWLDNDTQVVFTFKDGKSLPSDKVLNRIPEYQVAFNIQGNRIIKDKSGISRYNNHFKLTDAPHEESYKFSILPDLESPIVKDLKVYSEKNQNNYPKSIKIAFNEPMLIHTKSIPISGGLTDEVSHTYNTILNFPFDVPPVFSNLEPMNYKVKVTRKSSLIYDGLWSSIGGKAIFDPFDQTNQTILLKSPKSKSDHDIKNVYLNGVSATSITPNIINGNVIKNMKSKFYISLIPSDAKDSRLISFSSNNNAQSDVVEIAQNLMNSLNESLKTKKLPTSDAPFIVKGEKGFPEKLSITFNDLNGHFIGWYFLVATPDAGGLKFEFDKNNTVEYPSHGYLDIFKPGDAVEIEVDDSIVDPAGNTLAQKHKQSILVQ